MRIAAALLVGLLLAGCGGGGSSTPSVYRGTWVGTVAGRDAQGQPLGDTAITATVDERGRVAGTWADSLGNGTLAGAVDREGRLSLVVHYPDGDTVAAQGGTTLAGSDWQGSLAIQDPELAGWVWTFGVTRQ